MKIALTGASGLVGRWIARAAVEAGHDLDPLPGWRLGQPVDLSGKDALIHAAFQHIPGRFRGGEGDDPQGFIRANLDGSLALFQAARAQGVARVLFLSSRAVHDGHPAGMELPDELSPAPTSLYGEVKAQAEVALAALATSDFRTASLRPTGVYGPGLPQKWAGLIADFLAGTTPAPLSRPRCTAPTWAAPPWPCWKIMQCQAVTMSATWCWTAATCWPRSRA
ncbi:MAG: NAD(P)-dependent oxidoreductase [Paracoccus aminovorans]|nr:NAD(P)-dependent oxidoreductase [Paracoccus aminovorans]